jgi:hypothetical protein
MTDAGNLKVVGLVENVIIKFLVQVSLGIIVIAVIGMHFLMSSEIGSLLTSFCCLISALIGSFIIGRCHDHEWPIFVGGVTIFLGLVIAFMYIQQYFHLAKNVCY